MTGIPEPAIVDMEERWLAGMSFFGNPFTSHAGWTEENEIGRLWKRFMAYLGTGPEWASAAVPNLGFELFVMGPEAAATGEFEVFVAVELAVGRSLPIEVSAKSIPGGRYARFTISGADAGTDIHLAMSDWLGEHGYRREVPFSITVYDERFKGMDKLGESIFDMFMPLLEP